MSLCNWTVTITITTKNRVLFPPRPTSFGDWEDGVVFSQEELVGQRGGQQLAVVGGVCVVFETLVLPVGTGHLESLIHRKNVS